MSFDVSSDMLFDHVALFDVDTWKLAGLAFLFLIAAAICQEHGRAIAVWSFATAGLVSSAGVLVVAQSGQHQAEQDWIERVAVLVEDEGLGPVAVVDTIATSPVAGRFVYESGTGQACVAQLTTVVLEAATADAAEVTGRAFDVSCGPVPSSAT